MPNKIRHVRIHDMTLCGYGIHELPNSISNTVPYIIGIIPDFRLDPSYYHSAGHDHYNVEWCPKCVTKFITIAYRRSSEFLLPDQEHDEGYGD